MRWLLTLTTALSLLATPGPASAQPFEPAAASLTESDLPGYVLDEINTGSADYGPVSYFQAAFTRDSGEGEDPVSSTVTNLIGLSRVGPIAGLLESTMGGMLGDADQGAVPVDGPRIGERSYWYALRLEEGDALYEGYAVGFVQSDGIAIVSLGGLAGYATIDATAELAGLVASRLFNPNR